MFKLAIIIFVGAAAVTLAVAVGMFTRDDKRGQRTASARSEESPVEPPPPEATEALREPPPQLPRPAPTVAPRPTITAQAPASALLDEASTIAKLHDLAASDPQLSLKLAREALDRFPDSPDAPEFEWNVVKALANMDRYREAEEEARAMVEKYPDNPLSVDVDHHLLNHPPNPPGTP